MTQEIWKAIPGYEGRYEVSSCGNIRSQGRVVVQITAAGVRRDRHCRERLVKQHLNDRARPVVAFKVNGKTTHHRVHRLVALAFLGPCPEGMEVAHNDGNPKNNRIENLRYDTHSGNEADKVLHGTVAWGERNHNAKLTASDVHAIRRANESQRSLSRRFGVCRKHISQIQRGERWAHIQRDGANI